MDRRSFIKKTSMALLATAAKTNGSEIRPLSVEGMRYRRLGKTGLKISEIGIGGSPVPAEAIFRQAIERGVNYVDTSSSYMKGNSERIIGKILKEYPGKLHVATKIHAGRRGYSNNMLEAEFEGSLRRLGVDQVDILMVHGADNAEILADEFVLNLFAKLKKQGKIRFSGVSCHRNPIEVLTLAIKSGNYDMLNIGYNAFSGSEVKKGAVYPDYLQMSGIEGLINLAKKHDVGVVAMKTMAGGDRQDLRKYKKAGISLPQAKLKWVLQNQNVSTVISEMVTFGILEENLAVTGSQLSVREIAALNHHIKSCTAKTCRMCGQCVECPQGIAIPDILRYALYYHLHGKASLARKKYRNLPKSATYSNCSQCGNCLQACPNSINIIQHLHETHHLLA